METREVQELVLKHSCMVNNVSNQRMLEVMKKEFDLWQHRSNIKNWSISWDNWKELLNQKINRGNETK